MQAPSPPSLLVVSFSDDGATIAAGSSDCSLYCWSWDPTGVLAGPKCGTDAAGQPQEPCGTARPQPQELCRLQGHKNDVHLLQFSRAGTAVATGSRDGFVRVRP